MVKWILTKVSRPFNGERTSCSTNDSRENGHTNMQNNGVRPSANII